MPLEIFKVQIPVSTNEDVPMALIYNKHRDIMYQTPITKAIRKLFWEGSYKIYMFGKVVKEGNENRVELTSYAPEQKW